MLLSLIIKEDCEMAETGTKNIPGSANLPRDISYGNESFFQLVGNVYFGSKALASCLSFLVIDMVAKTGVGIRQVAFFPPSVMIVLDISPDQINPVQETTDAISMLIDFTEIRDPKNASVLRAMSPEEIKQTFDLFSELAEITR
jgi:hypothetical protein